MTTVRSRAVSLAPLVAIVLVGFVLRAVPLVGHSWPVGDGGLFYTMVGELRANGFALPATTSYDHAGIPFAYPPLALELAALAEAVVGLTRADVFRWLPLAFSTLSIPAVYLIGREVHRERGRALFAALVYATVPYAWMWLTMGSGITRSVGMFAALLATWRGLVLLRTGRRRDVIATGALAGLAVLSHPEAGIFVVIALGVRLAFERSLRNLANLALAATVAAALVAPWLGVVIAAHGIAPFESAAAFRLDPLSSVVVYLFAFVLLSPLPIAAALDILGQARDLAVRRPFLVAWRAALCMLDLRFAVVSVVVPFSLLAAHGLYDVVVPAARALAGREGDRRGDATGRAFTMHPRVHRRVGGGSVSAAVLAVASAGVVAGALLTPSVFLAPHTALSGDDLAALTWVRDHQPAERRFLVLATDTWGSDDLSEWFPALAGHDSLATSQGLEWVPVAQRAAHNARETSLRACPHVDVVCITSWLRADGGNDAGIYVPARGSAYGGNGYLPRVIGELAASRDFRRVYGGPGADVFVLSP